MAKLQRVIGLPMLIFYGMGMILGAGIYSIVGKASAIAGTSVWQSLLIAAMTATLAGLSYCELSAMYPKVGGEFLYLKKAFPRFLFPSHLIGFLMAIAGISSASAVALSFSGYFEVFFSSNTNLISLSLFYFFSLFSLLGIKESGWVNIIFTFIEMTGLIIFIICGLQSKLFMTDILTMPSLLTIKGSSLIIFAYFGFENLVNFAEEAKKPEINLPRAILISILLSTLLYILVIFSALSLMTLKELSTSPAPLADALRNIHPQTASVLASIALFATANTVLIAIVSTSRLLLGLSRNNIIPSLFSLLRQTNGTPWVSTLTIALAATFFILSFKIETLAGISSFATLIAFFSVHLSLIVLRFSHPNIDRPFKIPFSLFHVPLSPFFGLLVTLWLIFQFEKKVYQIGLTILFFLSLFLYFVELNKKFKKSVR